MSFSGLGDIFQGRIGQRECLAFLLSLKAPESARMYVYERHKQVFGRPNSYEKLVKRWQEYPYATESRNIRPVLANDLENLEFTKNLGETLAFDISRFTDFIDGYVRVAEDIKPVMLHYAINYLLDFFSRTYLKYGQSTSHGVKITPKVGQETVLQTRARILENGIFPRAVDAFYAVDQSSLFSSDDVLGIGHYFNVSGETTPTRLKLKCCDKSSVTLNELLIMYRYFNSIKHDLVTVANKILAGYLVLFLVSSLSRYRAEDWFVLRQDRDLSNRIELLNHDFVSQWIPELLLHRSPVS